MAIPLKLDAKMQKHPSHITALISPPEELLHDFNQSASSSDIAHATPGRMIQSLSDVRGPLSPTSPPFQFQQLTNRFQTYIPPSVRVIHQDPILYPEQSRSAEFKSLFDDNQYQHSVELKSASPTPLSRPHVLPTPIVDSDSVSPPETEASLISSGGEEQTEEERRKEAAIDDHYFNHFLPANSVRSKSKQTKWSKPRNLTPPTREEYRLMISFTDTIMKDIHANPQAFIKRAREEQEEDYHVSKHQKTASGYTTVLLPKDDKFRQKMATLVQPAPRVRKPAKKQVETSGTSQPEKHKRMVIKKPKQHFNYDDLPDYTPSSDTIPSDKSFRVTWAGQPLDLSSDPNHDLLHPAEIQLASKLRFPCDQYLKTKRRVFIGRVNNLIKFPNKQFCKTDAQQVGGVDVNKLSQLWEAYNSIGWFREVHFKDHVAKVKAAALVYDPKNCKWVDNKDVFA